MITTTDFFGKQHYLVPCTERDINVHFAKIEEFIPADEVVDFKLRMAECIDIGTAYMLLDGSCFLYYINYKPCCAIGVALYGKESPIKMLALFSGIFHVVDTDTFKLEFHLHYGKLVQEYKSLITEISLKRQGIPGHPLVIRIDELHKKIESIYNRRNIKWEL